MVKHVERFVLLILLTAFATQLGHAQIAMGGTYKLDQNVIASGGGSGVDAINSLYRIDGSIAQTAAGNNLNGTPYNVNSGFWTPLFSPTVANATITGRVLRNDGLGIRNVVVTLAGGSLTSTRIALSSSLGYFSFDQIEPGQIYQITVTSKHYGFAEPSQTISVFGDFANIVFQSSWQN